MYVSPTITPDEIGEMLGLSRNCVYEALQRGEIPALKIGRRWVVPRERFMRWFQGVCDERP